jgi:hypothetical protein
VPDDKLAEQIARVRRFTMGSGAWSVEDVLAVCDAAARAEQAERDLAGMREAHDYQVARAVMVEREREALRRELEAARAVNIAKAAVIDYFATPPEEKQP